MHFFMSFYGGQLKQLYTANFLHVFLIHLKWQSSSSFPNLMVQIYFFPNSTGPWKIPAVWTTALINIGGYYSYLKYDKINIIGPGHVAQSVSCLATDACLTADPGVARSILARSHTFVEIDHEMISKVILLPSDVSFKKGCCQLQVKVCAQSTS